ncbi:MAG: hypothetical protein Q4C54_01155 [Clostridia bacterium]|nr:hypothetical protein [Clostridia bacterium]
MFKEIYNLQMRNLERLGSSMFLALLMVVPTDNSQTIAPLMLNEVMSGLAAVLKSSLRKGDTITQFSATQFAMLLPTINYDSGRMVMERLKSKFYARFPSSNFILTYRLGPLTSSGTPDGGSKDIDG